MPKVVSKSKKWKIKTPEELKEVAQFLIGKGPQIYLLSGPLGAGKTRLVQEIALQLGNRGEPATSPTFSLQNVYSTTPPIYHYDLYQKGVDHFLELGLLEELEKPGFHLIEWGESLKNFLEKLGFKFGVIQISLGADERREIECLY
jgi:tRNA threonylcarbamoyladenosine biosynthesis protein TsaE